MEEEQRKVRGEALPKRFLFRIVVVIPVAGGPGGLVRRRGNA